MQASRGAEKVLEVMGPGQTFGEAVMFLEKPCSPARGRFSVTKRVIASRLDFMQEHFSRILHELAAAELIAMKGHEISVNDVPGLQALV